MGTFKSSPRPSSSRDSKTRDHLACLYGLARDDVDYMEKFPIVARKDEAAYGEYRTQRVILEIYDAILGSWYSGARHYKGRACAPAHPAQPQTEQRKGYFLAAAMAARIWPM